MGIVNASSNGYFVTVTEAKKLCRYIVTVTEALKIVSVISLLLHRHKKYTDYFLTVSNSKL
jgi:hypothetical protein